MVNSEKLIVKKKSDDIEEVSNKTDVVITGFGCKSSGMFTFMHNTQLLKFRCPLQRIFNSLHFLIRHILTGYILRADDLFFFSVVTHKQCTVPKSIPITKHDFKTPY
jgi:hypothetical protein